MQHELGLPCPYLPFCSCAFHPLAGSPMLFSLWLHHGKTLSGPGASNLMYNARVAQNGLIFQHQPGASKFDECACLAFPNGFPSPAPYPFLYLWPRYVRNGFTALRS